MEDLFKICGIVNLKKVRDVLSKPAECGYMIMR